MDFENGADIDDLLLRHLMGVTSAAEAVEVVELLKDPRVLQRFNELSARINSPELQQKFQDLDELEAYDKIVGGTARKKRARMLAVMTILLLAAVPATLWLRKTIELPQVVVFPKQWQKAVPGVPYLSNAAGVRAYLTPDLDTSFVSADLHITIRQNTIRFVGSKRLADTLTLTTVPGNKYQVTLTDGSLVHLNGKSSLRFLPVMPADARHVWLSGEASFSVTASEQNPFGVDTDQGAVQVLGTTFLVYASPKSMNTAVLTGRVRVVTPDTAIIAGGGEQVAVVKGTQAVKSAFDPGREDWRNDTLIFKNKKLGELFELVERNYPVKVQVIDSAILELLIVGFISYQQPAEDFFKRMRSLGALDFKRKGDTFEVRAPRYSEMPSEAQ